MSSRPLRPDGKPMRALRALAQTDPAQPLTEYGVWLASRATRSAYGNIEAFHAALRTLVDRGLAERTGRRGGYEWYITDAGREALREDEGR